jgi:hypothetical protein
VRIEKGLSGAVGWQIRAVLVRRLGTRGRPHYELLGKLIRTLATPTPTTQPTTALAREYIQQADHIPLPDYLINDTLNGLGRALHYFGVALRAQKSTPLGEDLPLYRDFLGRIRLLLDWQNAAAPALAAMIVARFSLVSSAFEILESGAAVTGAIQPSPEQLALWADMASNRQSGQTEEQKKKVAQLEEKLNKSNATLRDAVTVIVYRSGFEHAIRMASQRQSNAGAALELLAICGKLEDQMPIRSRPFAKLMIICLSAWVEKELLSGRHKGAAELLRQHGGHDVSAQSGPTASEPAART